MCHENCYLHAENLKVFTTVPSILTTTIVVRNLHVMGNLFPEISLGGSTSGIIPRVVRHMAVTR